MTELCERIKGLRKEKDLTMDMLVADLNDKYPELKLNKSMLSRWESGQNQPSLDNAKVLCMYFDVSLDYLIGLTEVKTPSRLLTRRLAAYGQKIIEAKTKNLE